MDFKKVFKKTAAVVVGFGLLATQAAPALALTQAEDGIYERVPMMGVRLSFVDFGSGSGIGTYSTDPSDADLTRFYMDMHFNDDMDSVDMGEVMVYGNDDSDTYGDASYEAMMVEFGDGYNSGALTDRDFAIVAKDSSNSNNIVYNILAYDATNNDVYTYSVDDKPSLNPNSLADFWQDAIDNGTVVDSAAETANVGAMDFDGDVEFVSDDDAQTDNYYVVVNWFEALDGGSSNQTAGDPDVLADEFDELYFYTTTPTGEEVAYKIDVNLSSAQEDAETPEVDEESVKAVMRGTRARIEWAPVMEEGVVGYEVALSGGEVDGGTTSGVVTTDIGEDASTLDGEAATGEGGVNWFTKNPLVFAVVEEGADYDLNIYTVNAEGDKSEGFEEDLEVETERVEFNDGTHLSDVEMDNTFYNYIQYLYKLAIVDGYSDGEYKADETVTRGQLAKFVVNAFQIPVMMGGEAFSDVDMDNTFYVHIQTLKNAGIVSGFTGGEFRPDEEVTRSQATKYIVNAGNFYSADNLATSNDCFDDVDGHSLEEYICALADYNDDEVQAIIGGYSDGNFGPEDPLTRGQMAKIILNAAGSVVVTEDADTAGEEVSFLNYTQRFSNDTDGALYSGTYDIDYLSAEDYFVRPFVAPVEVEDFDADASDADVTLTWSDLSADDSSVSGYVIERRERDGSETDDSWEQIDVEVGAIDVVNSIFADPDATTVTDDDGVSDDTRYEYRIAAFKYIPAFASDEDYADQTDVEAATDEERYNMVVGPWVFTSVKTTES